MLAMPIISKNLSIAGIVVTAIMACLLLPLAEVQSVQADGEQNRFAAQTKVHFAKDAITLQPGKERAVTFNTDSNASSVHIVGNATVEGGGIWIRATDSDGRCPGMEACTQAANYSKGTPMSYNIDDIQYVEILIPAEMKQLVFYSPTEQAGTITLDFDIVNVGG
jgi:hypothetical protein